MESCAAEKVPVIVASASAHPRIGGCLESTASVMTESAINTMASSAQGMACATAATASAGMAGRGMLAKSGWEPSTEKKKDTGGSETRPTINESHDQAGTKKKKGKKQRTQLGNHQREKTKHGCNFAYN